MKIVKFGMLVIGVVAAIAAWCALAVFLGFYGRWMTPIADEGDHASFFAEAKQIVDDSNPGNAAFLLISNGEVVGEFYAQDRRGVDETQSFRRRHSANG